MSQSRKSSDLTTECENTRYRDNGGIMAKKIPEGKAELSVYVDKELKLKFKVACTQQDKSMGDVVNELIEDWLSAQNPQK
ncbi:MAG: plasmid partition protein ParG [Cuspidothrix sp.]